MKLVPLASAIVVGACVLAVDGCAHLPGSMPSNAPTAAPTSSASPATCTATASATAQIVAISPLVTPTVDPVYGLIAGYGLATSGNSSNVAAPIAVPVNDTIQFFNNDESTSQLRYSAAGIAGATAFPSPTFTFPASAVNATGTQINATTTWSTGLLGGQCYSQVFTIAAAGTYYFGDYTYYGLANLRDVIVATSSSSL
jgi:hypothetical protein